MAYHNHSLWYAGYQRVSCLLNWNFRSWFREKKMKYPSSHTCTDLVKRLIIRIIFFLAKQDCINSHTLLSIVYLRLIWDKMNCLLLYKEANVRYSAKQIPANIFSIQNASPSGHSFCLHKYYITVNIVSFL